MTAAHQPELVAAAQAAVSAGMKAANEYHSQAGRVPGVGAAVSLPVPASGAATGLNFSLPADVPAIRPAPPRQSAPMVVADPVVGGITYVGPGGQLDGSRLPSVRGDSLVYLSASRPSTESRPSLGDRLRGAWRALFGR
jgi:hypothetical protein